MPVTPLFLRVATVFGLVFLCACDAGFGAGQAKSVAASTQAVPADPDVGPEGINGIRVVRVGPLEYTYRLYATGAAIAAGSLPLVVSLHGGGTTASGHDSYTRLREKAAAEGFALLSPDGTGTSWNAGSCCEPSAGLKVDHTQVISVMLDDAATVLPLDARRLYAAGHSNGGMMAYRLACELSGRFAAVAVNAGVMMERDLDADPPRAVYQCQPQRPVPILHMHGLEDRCVPFEGGESAGDAGGERPPASDSINFWLNHNLCSLFSRRTYRQGGARCGAWDCAAGAEVELCTVEGGGHVWPGNGDDVESDDPCGGTASSDLVANDHLWVFFNRHRLP